MQQSDIIFLFGILICIVVVWVIRKQYIIQPSGYARPPKAMLLDPFFGLDFMLKVVSDVENFKKFHQKYGKTYYTTPLLGDPQISTAEAINVHEIISNGRMWGNSWRLQNMKQLTGMGFLNTDGERSREARKMLKPCFNRINVTDFDFMDRCMQGVLSKIKAAGPGNGVDLSKTFYEAFMDSALHFILGIDATNSNESTPIPIPEFRIIWEGGLMRMGARLVFGSMSWILPRRQYARFCDQITFFVDFYIQLSKASPKGSTAERKSAAEAFSHTTDDNTYIRSQLIQTMLGAQETTSTLICNALEMLARQPDIWREVREEVKEKCHELKSFDQLRENRLIQNILMECLRLRPVFASLKRVALNDTTLPKGGGPDGQAPIFVAKGTAAQSSFYVLNRDPAVFGPDVELFNAHRFDNIKPSSKEFMPFGAGSRSCLGRDKAQVEAAYVIVRLAQEFEELEWKGPKEAKVGLKMLTRNKDGCTVSFRKTKIGP